MNYHLFACCLLLIPLNLQGSRIIASVADNKKYEYRTNVFRLLHVVTDDGDCALFHLLRKSLMHKHTIPKRYKTMLKVYGFYKKGVYIIDRAIIKPALVEYMAIDSDVSMPDAEPEEMPRD